MSFASRLLKEEHAAAKYTDPDVLLYKAGGAYEAFVHGPPCTPYVAGIFNLRLRVPDTYPIEPPQVFFVTKVFHPNIHPETGEVCLDIIKEQWTPSWTLTSICKAVLCLLETPNPDSPLNCDAGNLLRHGDLATFEQLAALYTLEEAIPKSAFQSAREAKKTD